MNETTNKIRLVYMDIDGTLTDGRVSIDMKGNEYIHFSKLDGFGIELLKEKGIKIVWATREKEVMAVRTRAKKLQIDYFIFNEKDKLAALQKLCKRLNLSINEVAAIGDDVNDLEVLETVALKACPADAQDRIKSIPNMQILKKTGGNGAVREFIDNFLLKGVTFL